MLTFLGIAFFIGMSHALEADHVAAVSALATRQSRVSSIVRTGAAWGIGHTLTLLVFAGISLSLHLAINEQLAGWLEFFVGLMLMGLGGHILFRLAKDRVHFHLHKHPHKHPHKRAGEQTHFHAHSHTTQTNTPHEATAHHHDHKSFPKRSMFVGMMHGMAGSAALLALTASSAPSPAVGLLYVLLFGMGSILGMATLSVVIAVPIALSARFLTWTNRSLQAVTGLATFLIGLYTVVNLQTVF
ncbi:MAG: high frequency lysogenization protein HflD [Magnetovibrio sp.]|nr:high frequency lysogenization protein HflD [Magnetovibrio sp.]